MLPGSAPGELGGTYDHPVVVGWANKADLVGGKIPTSQIPSLATIETETVNTTAERLALTTSQVQPGDRCIQLGNPGRGTYFLKEADPSLEASWVLSVAPTDAVTSVNGYSGTVVLGKADVNLANVDNTSDANKPVSTAQQTALDAKVPTSRTVSAGTGLTGGGALTANITLTVAYGTTSTTACRGDDARLSDARTPLAHSHNATDINAGTFSVSRLPLGSTSTTVCVGNDSRLSDARTPLTHTHSTADVTTGTANVLTRVGTTASSATPSFDSSVYDSYHITALAAAITSVTISNGADGKKVIVRIKDNGTARAIAWGSSFTGDLPTTTTVGKTLMVGLIYDSAAAKWVAVAKTEY